MGGMKVHVQPISQEEKMKANTIIEKQKYVRFMLQVMHIGIYVCLHLLHAAIIHAVIENHFYMDLLKWD